MTGLAIQGLLERPGHIAGGEVWLGQQRIDTLDDRAMEKIRGREIGAIFRTRSPRSIRCLPSARSSLKPSAGIFV